MLGGNLERRELLAGVEQAKRNLWKAEADLRKAKKKLDVFDKMGFRSNA